MGPICMYVCEGVWLSCATPDVPVAFLEKESKRIAGSKNKNKIIFWPSRLPGTTSKQGLPNGTFCLLNNSERELKKESLCLGVMGFTPQGSS